MITFKEFMRSHTNGALERCVTWRGYDIPAVVQPTHYKKALKALGYTRAGELAVPVVAYEYGIKNSPDCRELLGIWWVYSRVMSGVRFHGLKPKNASVAGEGR